MKVGMAADHAGFELKENIRKFLEGKGYEIKDFGALNYDKTDDYPDYIIPLAKAVATKEVEKGIAICGSGVGAAVVSNKINGVRSALITEHFSAHQGVEDDDMNIICMGGRITGYASARELAVAFLEAKFSGLDRHKRRLEKVALLEQGHE